MEIYDKKEAILKMNSLGARGIPFVFIVDFEMEKVVVAEMDELGDDIWIRFPDYSYGEDDACVVSDIDWIKTPISFEQYREGYENVLKEINLGNTFLINLAYPTDVFTSLNLEDIYFATDAKYKLLLKDQFTIFSPETFVKIVDGHIYTYPMKGTIDADVPDALATILADEKELAEHYTIVDLLRNDMSIVAKEVEVTRFRYPDYLRTNSKNLIQISSEIKGRLPADYRSHIGSILEKMLPAGSISGAPKKKTIEIIQASEKRPRGYYTGISGYFDGNNLDSAVNIRYIEQSENGLQYMSGGGITFQSDLYQEYEELINKVYLPTKLKGQQESDHISDESCT